MCNLCRNENYGIPRRDFIKTVGISAAGVSLGADRITEVFGVVSNSRVDEPTAIINSAFIEPEMTFEVNVPSFPDEKFNVMDFGAMGNGVELDTKAIQKAIDYCATANGGTVYFPPGVYLSGTLFLSSSVNIHLNKGAILLGSHRLEDYPETIPELRSYTDNYTVRSLIYAEGKVNIAITGEGIIDGQGAKFPVVRHPYKNRPYTIRMIECTDILIEYITILNSPMWVQHYLACDHLTIQNITVSSRKNASLFNVVNLRSQKKRSLHGGK